LRENVKLLSVLVDGLRPAFDQKTPAFQAQSSCQIADDVRLFS
jgi:hypothetical protein